MDLVNFLEKLVDLLKILEKIDPTYALMVASILLAFLLAFFALWVAHSIALKVIEVAGKRRNKSSVNQ